jgi:hypothetical protein
MTVRTTIVLDEGLLGTIRAYAASHALTLSRAIEDLTRFALQRSQPQPEEPYDFDSRWPTFRGDGLQPGVSSEDLASRARLYPIMTGDAWKGRP